MMNQLSQEEKDFVVGCLADYYQMMQAGLCLRYKLLDERQEALNRLDDILTTLDNGKGRSNVRTQRDTGRYDLTPRSTDENRDDATGDRRPSGGYSSEGIDTAHRSDESAGREVSDSVGSETDASAPIDEQTDDTGILSSGE